MSNEQEDASRPLLMEKGSSSYAGSTRSRVTGFESDLQSYFAKVRQNDENGIPQPEFEFSGQEVAEQLLANNSINYHRKFPFQKA